NAYNPLQAQYFGVASLSIREFRRLELANIYYKEMNNQSLRSHCLTDRFYLQSSSILIGHATKG
ncbi:hypothetical protein, partial [Bradyrhizobium sp. sGM-13]|uniref:hypothetical protein n=1 Tax=Bradyrhizobium sp. sGM-13 TaxID=2831781 RepID=UPI001BCFC59F